MTNTIPNVPRELLERAWRALANSATGREIGAYLDADPCAPECSETCARASMCSTCSATLSSPSPAGVDGWDVAGDILEKLSAAQAIIGGLQEKIERLQFSLEVAKTDELSAAVYAETESIKHSLWDAEKERYKKAQRIGELEGLLMDVAGMFHGPGIEGGPLTKLRRRIDAALAAVCAAAPNIATTSEHNGS